MASFILLAGLHLSIASHLCQGELISVKVCFANKEATSCCMEGISTSSPSGKIFKKHCCDNGLTTLAVDDNYSPSFSENLGISPKVTQVFIVPLKEMIREMAFSQSSHPILSPPGIIPKNTVELTEICVFRI